MAKKSKNRVKCAALQRGLKAIAGGQFALIDIRLAKAAETNERPDRAN
jgi:hypothetical protein